MVLFQPGEETAQGARAMISDSLFDRIPRPQVVLGQLVMVDPSGAAAVRSAAVTFAADSLQVRLFGKGALSSMPQSSVDPVIKAASTVRELQTIVSRELSWRIWLSSLWKVYKLAKRRMSSRTRR